MKPVLIEDKKIILHQGVYKPMATVPEAVFMIVGMTIGAGILGIPYVVSQVGLVIGLTYILILGLVMLFVNLLIGEVAVRTKQSLQLAGLAGKYLGNWARYLLTIFMILGSYGALLAYIVGEGNTLSLLLGGDPAWWGVFAWGILSLIVWRGLRTIKTAEKILAVLIIIILVALSLALLPKFDPINIYFFDTAKFFLPFGVVMFALNAMPAVVEAHALLPGSQRHFRKALIVGSAIPIAIYMLFALAVVGAQGLNTTELATIGLSQSYGNTIALLGNCFAVLAMSSGFIGVGISLKQTLVWDNKINKLAGELLVILVPLVLYMLGVRQFVEILGIVGGVFVALPLILLIIVCLVARKKGDLDASRYMS